MREERGEFGNGYYDCGQNLPILKIDSDWF